MIFVLEIMNLVLEIMNLVFKNGEFSLDGWDEAGRRIKTREQKE